MTATPPLEPGKAPALPKAPTGVVTALVPASISEVAQLSGMVARAGWAPLSYRLDVPRNQAGARVGKPEDMGFDEDKIAIGIMQGLEVGLKPIQALQSIAVINGIPALYGDSMLAVINATGQVEDFSEVPTVENGSVVGWTATMKRKGRPTATVRTFTVEDAKSAKLLDKQGPWTQYRSRMLQMRARALCLRDSFPDALKGLSMVEEVQDVTVTAVPLAAPAPRSAVGKLDAFAEVPKPVEPEDAEFTEETAHDPVTGEVIETEVEQGQFDADGLPASVKVAFDAAKFTPFLQWLDVELQKLAAAPEVKQGLVDRHADRLKTVYDSGKAAEAAVRKLVTTFEVTVPFIVTPSEAG